jgi:diguanylate cyclase (GGDEF)-like protein
MRSLMHLDDRTAVTRRGAVLIGAAAAVYVVMIAWTIPHAADPQPAIPAVPLAHALVLGVLTSLTALALWVEAAGSRRRGYLVLGGTFASITVVMVGFVLSFPWVPAADESGSPTPILGGPSTAATMFLLWHLVLAVGIPWAAVVLTHDVAVAHRPELRRLWPGVVLGIVPAALVVLWLLLVPGSGPTIIVEGAVTPDGNAWFWLTTVVSVAGLVVTVAVTRGRTTISRWLIAVSILNVGDGLLNALAERYSTGWYVGRALGFVALSALLLVLMWEQSRVDQQMQELATRDALTGARARVTFTADAARELARASHDGSRVGLLWLDLDVFKQVNDRFGHTAGDRVLVEAYQRIERGVRERDLVVRMGGDEFGLLLVGLQDAEEAGTVADRVVAAMREPIDVGGAQVAPHSSIGLAVFPDTARDVEELVHQADVAMYAAKSAGGDRWAAYDPAHDVGYSSRATLRRSLDTALAEHQLDLDAQPIVSTVDGTTHGVELLLRWVHDGRRTSGGPFAVEAERSGRSDQIAATVLDLLEANLEALLQSHPGCRMISINLCVPDLLHAGIVGRLSSPPFAAHADRIVLEVTESSAIDDRALGAIQNLDALRALGYRLALDDFGVGFSNIVRTQQLRPDVLKIDRSLLVRASSGEPRGAELLAWAASLGRTLGALTVVEGVETDEEAALVRSVGADLAQGYWYARPSPICDWTRSTSTATASAVTGI